MAEPVIKNLSKSDGTTVTFVIHHLPAFKAIRTSRQVIGLAGPIVPLLVASKAKLGESDVGELIAALGAVNDQELIEIAKVLAAHCQVHGRKGDLIECFDLLFTGELELMVRWFIAALDHNFGPTLRALLQGKQGA